MSSTYYSNPYFYNTDSETDLDEPWIDDTDPKSIEANQEYHRRKNQAIKDYLDGVAFPNTNTSEDYQKTFKEGKLDYNCKKCQGRTLFKIENVMTFKKSKLKTKGLEYFIKGHCLICFDTNIEYVKL